MLPARSQATSVGRLKLEPGDARAGPALAPPPAAAAAAAATAAAGRRRRRRRRTHGDRFRLAAEHQRDAALGVELHDLVGADVDRPDVVLRIDAQADRGVEAVDVLPELAHELAGRHRTGTAASRRGRTCGCRRASRRDGRCACRRRSGPSSSRRRRRLRRRRCRSASSAGRRWCRTAISGTRRLAPTSAPPSDERRGHGESSECAWHHRSYFRWLASSRRGFSRIFCERQLLISAV